MQTAHNTSYEGQSQENKQLFTRGVEAINNRNWEALNDLIAPNYVRHCQATLDVNVNSLEIFKQFLRQDAGTSPDLRMTIQRLVAEGDWWNSTVPRREWQACGSVLTWDTLAALSQLGHFPPPVQETR